MSINTAMAFFFTAYHLYITSITTYIPHIMPHSHRQVLIISPRLSTSSPPITTAPWPHPLGHQPSSWPNTALEKIPLPLTQYHSPL